jgi:hypothetical protein
MKLPWTKTPSDKWKEQKKNCPFLRIGVRIYKCDNKANPSKLCNCKKCPFVVGKKLVITLLDNNKTFMDRKI